jgi:gliding motility-associated-like protein
VHTFEKPGIYDVSLTVTSILGCKAEYTFNNMINVFANPVADFEPVPDSSSILKPEIYFANTSKGAYWNYWNFGDSSISEQANPAHNYKRIGKYNVCLRVVTGNGCADSVCKTVTITNYCAFYMPDAFSPDDDGINEKAYPVSGCIDPEHYHFYIYDRWGEIVFETDKYDIENPAKYGWDGRIKGRKIGEVAVYTWLVLYNDWNGKEYQEAGALTLIR